MSVLLALCTAPNTEAAERIAHALVDERLAACANRLPGVRSTYRWRGQVSTDEEVLLLIKTTAGRFDALCARILELHPYELPELIAFDVAAGLDRYLAWVAGETRAE